MQVWLRGCRKCCGPLVSELDELVCLQCGGRCYPRRALADLVAPEPELPAVPYSPSNPRRRRSQWSEELADRYIDQLERGDRRWWTRNAETIRRLDAGERVKSIAPAVGKTERTIRFLREELRDRRLELETDLNQRSRSAS